MLAPTPLYAKRFETHMHVDLLSVPFAAAHYCGNEDQSIFGDEIPYTSLIPVVVSCMCREVEFESQGKGQKEYEKLQERRNVRHWRIMKLSHVR